MDTTQGRDWVTGNDVSACIGTAGWSIPRGSAQEFPRRGTHLERYAQVMSAAEINSSFYRSHATRTYERWAESVPNEFRFSVKVPRLITHDNRLRYAAGPFSRFLDETAGLGPRRGPLLVQLPPSAAFEPRVVQRFFAMTRRRHSGPIVCEPRHPSWFSEAVNRLLEEYDISRVAADPAAAADAAVPAGSSRCVYVRWHGSPHMYWSSYDSNRLQSLAAIIRDYAARAEVWCIFDNTASGAAIQNALNLRRILEDARAGA